MVLAQPQPHNDQHDDDGGSNGATLNNSSITRATNGTTSSTNYENNNGRNDNHNYKALDVHIKILFLLNGLVQVIPNLALMALINDKIQLPAEYIPAYYAIEFLPYSLKPIYGLCTYWITTTTATKTATATATAITEEDGQGLNNHNSIINNVENEEWSDNITIKSTLYTSLSSIQLCKPMITIQRHSLLIFLQICTSLTFIFTSSLEQNQIIQSFVMGFLRSFTMSWAEFLLGLALITSVKSMVRIQETYHSNINIVDDDRMENSRIYEEKILSLHQSQAATYRNIGSLIGEVIIFTGVLTRNFFIMQKEKHENDDDDNDDSLHTFFITSVILGTAIIPLIAAYFAYKGQVGTDSGYSERQSTYTTTTQQRRRHNPSRNSYNRIPTAGDDSSITNTMSSNSSSSYPKNHHLFRIKRIAIYLILRHAIPSTSGIIGSFEYTIFRSNPLYLQCMALITSICAVFASSFYGFYISQRFANIKDITYIIVITTIVSSFWSLVFLPFFHKYRENEIGNNNLNVDLSYSSIKYQVSLMFMIMFSLYQVVRSFFEEVSFLPSVIIATNAVVNDSDFNSSITMNSNDIEPQQSYEETTCTENNNTDSNDPGIEHTNAHKAWYLDDGVLYGFMISCIDFGDQIGDWISGPIVKALNIQRENKWQNLNWFVVISAASGVISLVFLRLLWYSSRPIDRDI